MATEKRLISVGDVLYIIGKYSFSPDENPQVVEVQVAYHLRKNLYAYPTKGHGTFKFANSDLGRTVFYNRKEAERLLGRILDASD
jgi:hypothetical protein